MPRHPFRAASAALAVVLALATGGAGSALADDAPPPVRPGSLVTSFGSGGVLRPPSGAGKPNADAALATDAAGRPLLLTSDEDGGSRLVRLLEDGSEDPGFGSAGSAALPAGTWEDVAVEPQGRIVLSGTSAGDLAVARLDPDGTPDPSFGSAGVARLHISLPGNFDSVKESLSRIAPLPDGGIVAGGSLDGCYPENCFVKAEVATRFTAAGTPDPSFAAGGAYVADFGARNKKSVGNEQAFSAIAAQPDGKVLLGGSDGWSLTVLRLTPTGAPDPSFGRSGYFATEYETEGEEGYYETGTARALLIEGSGRIVAVGDRFLYGLRTDGRLDPGFGHDGHASVAPAALAAESAETTDALIDAAGQIVVVGAGTASSTVDRYLPDGRADARFFDGGLASLGLADGRAPDGPFGEFIPPEASESVVQLPDGDLLAAGYAYADSKEPRREATVIRRNDLAGSLARCDGKPVVFQGTPGPDHIGYVRGPIATFGGNDVIHGGLGPACTGLGNDFVRDRSGGPISLGTGDDRALVGDARVLAGPGDDILRIAPGFTAPIEASGGAGDDLLVGGDYRDKLFGGAGDDRLYGKGGRDVLRGGAGNDLLAGGGADDVLDGGPGHDRLLPGPGGPPTTTYATKSRGFRLRIVARR
jgi:uncharacterized delta-60 repeat protein